MKKTSTTLDRNARKRWLTCPALAIVLALLLVLSSLPVYASEQQTEKTETPTVTQDAGSESAQSAASSEQNEPFSDELDAQNAAIAATTELQEEPPHEGAVLNGGYVGFKNKDSGKYLTIPNGSTTVGTNVCQQSANNNTNAQEFYLSYTHNAKKNISYFTIRSIDSTGALTQMYVKAAAIGSSGYANVSLQYFMPTEFNDRWQFEHYEDNYYIIHVASRPYESGSRYVLCAQPGEGSAAGSAITDQGNVFVTTLTANSTPSDSMLWQICADGMPMDINSNDISDGGSYDVDETDELTFYYIPKSFNQSLTWLSSNSYSVTTPNTLGQTTAIAPGKSTIKIAVVSGGNITYETAEIYVKLPNGVYYLRNVSTQMLLDLDKDDIKSGTPIQVYNGGTGEPTNLSQLYKFNYLGNGLYSIRPMRKNDMGISWSATTNSVTIQDIGTNNQNVPNTGQWYLNKNSNGYYFYAQTGTLKTITVPTNAASSTDLVVQSYTGNTHQVWSITSATNTYSQLMIAETFAEITAQNTYSFDVWYVTSDPNINGSAVIGWSIEQSENIIEKGVETNSYNTLIPGIATLRFTVTNAGNTISDFTPKTQNVLVEYPTPSTGDWFIQNAASAYAITTLGYSSSGSIIGQAIYTDHIYMEWELIHVSQNYYRIKSKHSGLYLSAQSNVSNPIILSSNSDAQSLWKFEKTAVDRYKIINKAYESGNQVLSTASNSGGSLYLYTYTDNTDYKDEWTLNISGDELTILAIADPDRTRGADAIQAANTAETRYVGSNAIVAYKICTEAVVRGMETSEVFVSRSHGSPTSIQINDDSLGRDTMFLRVQDIYDYETQTAIANLNGCDLVAFVGCETGAATNNQGIIHAAVAAGADAAIGFKKSIGSGSADLWTVHFLDYYTQGYSIEDSINKALQKEHGGDVDSVIVYPEY